MVSDLQAGSAFSRPLSYVFHFAYDCHFSQFLDASAISKRAFTSPHFASWLFHEYRAARFISLFTGQKSGEVY